MRQLYNDIESERWDEIRDFLALHYKLNTRLVTPFWQHCRADTDLGAVAPIVEFYRENGPSALARYLVRSQQKSFGVEGYLVMLVGNRVPYEGRHHPTADEWQRWHAMRKKHADRAQAGLDVRESLACIRHPAWRWD